MSTHEHNVGPALEPETVSKAVQDADLRVLLMMIVQISGDLSWLEPPFLPKRDVRLIADENAGLDPDVAAKIRKEAVRLLSQPTVTPAFEDPGDELMVRLMSVCLGEAVPPEYAPMMREEMGFVSRQVAWDGTVPKHVSALKPIAIVGAGASGIALAANLEKLGLPYVVLEKNDQVGGTWHENTYPGCGVDTPNHAYSFSFGQRYGWSRYFAPQPEIYDYLVKSADEAGIRPHIRFQTTVTRADWDDTENCWRIQVSGPEGLSELEASCLVSAIGQLSLPSEPEIAGKEDFRGQMFHATHWPETLDIKGKSVAVIGTGASSMQIVPTIADQVKKLSVFQRSPQWARPIPRYHDPIESGAQWLLQHVPIYAAWYRFTMLWRYGDGLLPTLRKDPDWEHPERSINRINDKHRAEMEAHIRTELEGREDLIEKCVPSYPAYGKRILLDNGWYQAIRRENVDLISDSIDHINPNGLVTSDGQLHQADVIVFATGFKVGQMAARLNITGRNGRKLSEEWQGDNPSAHLGITVSGFPNLFCMQGPNTGLGHGGSAIFQAECQARYIAGAVTEMAEQGVVAMDVRKSVQDAYTARVDAEHEAMIWTHRGMSTYYRNAKGRVISVMPWRLVDYWSMTHSPDLSEYELVGSRR